MGQIKRHRRSSRPVRVDDRGANLVEFALVAPLLIILVLGIVEFGILFGEYNEIRHSAREGSRYAAVSNPDLGEATWEDNVVKSVCDSLNLPNAGTISVSVSGPTSGAKPAKGEYATVSVTANVSSLSGTPLISSFIPSSLSNDATFRMERDAEWTSPVNGTC